MSCFDLVARECLADLEKRSSGRYYRNHTRLLASWASVSRCRWRYAGLTRGQGLTTVSSAIRAGLALHSGRARPSDFANGPNRCYGRYLRVVPTTGPRMRSWGRGVWFPTEMYGYLVDSPVFKTGETEYLGLAGSIPVHLRQTPPAPYRLKAGEPCCQCSHWPDNRTTPIPGWDSGRAAQPHVHDPLLISTSRRLHGYSGRRTFAKQGLAAGKERHAMTDLEEAALGALSPIESTMNADGYTLKATEGPGGQLEIRIEALDGACEDCLVPESVMLPMMQRMLVTNAVTVRSLKVAYPADSASH